MNRQSWLARLMLGLIAALSAHMAFAGPSFPELTGKVVDQAGVLSPQTEAALTQDIEALEGRTGHQVAVVTVPSLQGLEIEDYGILLGRKWALGRPGENDGVLLILAPKQRKVRIEVGYGLESALTQDTAKAIVTDDIIPRLKVDDIDGGVTAGTEAIIKAIDAPPPAPPAVAGTSQPAAATSPAAATASPLPGGLSIGSAILIALVGAVLFRMLGGGKRTQILYAPPVAAPPQIIQMVPATPASESVRYRSLTTDDEGLPVGLNPVSPVAASPAGQPPVAGPDNPMSKVMHTTIGDALTGILGKTMGPGLVPGLLVGASAGAGGMLLANRIRNGTWFGEGNPHKPAIAAAAPSGSGGTGGGPPAIGNPPAGGAPVASPDNTGAAAAGGPVADSAGPAGATPAAGPSATAPPAAGGTGAPASTPGGDMIAGAGGGAATFNGGGASGSW